MATNFEGNGSWSPGNVVNPYLPSVLALETGDLTDPESKARPLDEPAGVILANGMIPNVR